MSGGGGAEQGGLVGHTGANDGSQAAATRVRLLAKVECYAKGYRGGGTRGSTCIM